MVGLFNPKTCHSLTVLLLCLFHIQGRPRVVSGRVSHHRPEGIHPLQLCCDVHSRNWIVCHAGNIIILYSTPCHSASTPFHTMHVVSLEKGKWLSWRCETYVPVLQVVFQEHLQKRSYEAPARSWKYARLLSDSREWDDPRWAGLFRYLSSDCYTVHTQSQGAITNSQIRLVFPTAHSFTTNLLSPNSIALSEFSFALQPRTKTEEEISTRAFT